MTHCESFVKLHDGRHFSCTKGHCPGLDWHREGSKVVWMPPHPSDCETSQCTGALEIFGEGDWVCALNGKHEGPHRSDFDCNTGGKREVHWRHEE